MCRIGAVSIRSSGNYAWTFDSQPMITYPNRPIRTGYAFRDGKLYYFGKHGILVASQWPDMMAWRKTPKRPHWQQVRPLLQVHFSDGMWTGYLASYRVKKHRPRAMDDPLRFRINEPQPIACDAEFIDIAVNRQQKDDEEVSDELLSSEERIRRAY